MTMWQCVIPCKTQGNCRNIDEIAENEEGSNGKQQCGNVSFPTKEAKGKHRRNWYHFHLYTIYAKQVTTMPDDTQVALQYLKQQKTKMKPVSMVQS